MKTTGNMCYILIFLDLALNFWFEFYIFITLLEIHKPNECKHPADERSGENEFC